jgi:hypothetical protein
MCSSKKAYMNTLVVDIRMSARVTVAFWTVSNHTTQCNHDLPIIRDYS